jgi:hypothetical protein
MATKKTTKTKTTKSAKLAAAKKAKPAASKKSAKPAAAKKNAKPTPGECPRGGEHEWTEEDGERFCAKCMDSAHDASKNAKAKAKTKTIANGTAKAKGLSALDAAAKVLAESAEPMTTKELVDAMATKGLWTSPGGKTPDRTLYSAILREHSAKGSDARFTKIERGKFTTTAKN